MIGRLEVWLRNLRRRASRSEWSVRWLGRPLAEGTETHSGLVLIHLTAVLLDDVNEALAQRRAPFLKRLLEIEDYHLQPLAGCGSSAAVDDEARLFYGVTDHRSASADAGGEIGQNATIEFERA